MVDTPAPGDDVSMAASDGAPENSEGVDAAIITDDGDDTMIWRDNATSIPGNASPTTPGEHASVIPGLPFRRSQTMKLHCLE